MGSGVIGGSGPASDKSSSAMARWRVPVTTSRYFVGFTCTGLGLCLIGTEPPKTSANRASILPKTSAKLGKLAIPILDSTTRKPQGQRGSCVVGNEEIARAFWRRQSLVQGEHLFFYVFYGQPLMRQLFSNATLPKFTGSEMGIFRREASFQKPGAIAHAQSGLGVLAFDH